MVEVPCLTFYCVTTCFEYCLSVAHLLKTCNTTAYMLIHVPTKLLAKQRLRLLFCTATCLLLAGYILTFLRLESLLGLSESQQFYENVADYRHGVQFLCRETMARDRLWKHAAANVLIKRNWMTGDDMGFGRDILADKKQNFKPNDDALVRQKSSQRDENVPILRNKRANPSFLKSKNNFKNSENFLKAKDANDQNAAFNAMSSSSSNDNLFDKFQSLMEQICQEYTSMLATDDNAEIVTYQSNSNLSNVVNIEIEVKNMKNQADDRLQTADGQFDITSTKKVPASDMLDEDQVGYLKEIVKIFSQRRRDVIGDTDFHLKMKKKRLKPRLEIHRTPKSGYLNFFHIN
ncbi:hypothetical protein HELRODRAFT_183630 [Helobdella robusta]|uniref:Uncharacterized protein n=1 Tax=Helobdella robusta TaxID=6412 RepID=T1FJY8_HELRO|nr:hypothetical protein HELRODRAFT_183630 [Helobdella robusta]ESO10409.1 hypothetical protein HELRODRAFT_183630 [Helobdella robusta]